MIENIFFSFFFFALELRLRICPLMFGLSFVKNPYFSTYIDIILFKNTTYVVNHLFSCEKFSRDSQKLHRRKYIPRRKPVFTLLVLSSWSRYLVATNQFISGKIKSLQIKIGKQSMFNHADSIRNILYRFYIIQK